jgi:hypothetical protein
VRVARQRVPRIPRAVAVRPNPSAGGFLEGGECSVPASGTLRARGREPGGAAEWPTVSGRAAGRWREKQRRGRRRGERGRSCRAGPGWQREKEREGEERAHVGRLLSTREKKERGRRSSGWAVGPAGPMQGGKKKRRGVGCGEESRPKRERGKGSRPGQGVWAAFLSFFPFSFSTLKPSQQFYLNSNEFEFKPYTLHTNKTNAPA